MRNTNELKRERRSQQRPPIEDPKSSPEYETSLPPQFRIPEKVKHPADPHTQVEKLAVVTVGIVSSILAVAVLIAILSDSEHAVLQVPVILGAIGGALGGLGILVFGWPKGTEKQRNSIEK